MWYSNHQDGIVVCRRHSRYKWLRPYDEFLCSTWSRHIRTVNKGMRKKRK